MQSPSSSLTIDDDAENHAAKHFCREAAWKFQDDLLSSLLHLVGDETTVVLVSPHATADPLPGMEGAFPTSGAAVRRFGVACLAGPGIRRGAVLQSATVLDIVPTILSLFGLPLGEDMDGRPWQETFSESINIRHTPTWELIATAAESPTSKNATALPPVPQSSSEEWEAEGKNVAQIIRRNQKINLALALSDSDRASLAIDCWKELMSDYPEDTYFPLQLISCLIKNKEYLECGQIIGQLTPEIANHPQVRLALAELALAEGRIDEVRHILCDLSDDLWSSPLWLNQAGGILLKCEAWEDAEKTFLNSLQMQADNPIARNGLSTIYWEQDRYEDAIRESRRVLESAPSFAQARFTLAKCLRGMGKDLEAIDAFEGCLHMGYQPQETHGYLASLYRVRDPIRANYHQRCSGVC